MYFHYYLLISHAFLFVLTAFVVLGTVLIDCQELAKLS